MRYKTAWTYKYASYYIGTGLISVVGVSFTVIPVAEKAFDQMYANGFCPVGEDGTRLACPDAYGALLGTAAVAALFEILLAFVPPRIILKVFPPLVTGPTVMVRLPNVLICEKISKEC